MRPSATRRPGAPLCLLATVCAAACASGGGGQAELVGAASMVALALPAEPPRLPDAVEAYELGDDGEAAVAQWNESWEADGAKARALRVSAYRLASPGLAREMSTREVAEYLADVKRLVQAAELVEGSALPIDLEDVVRRARALGELAESTFHARRPDAALQFAMEAADALRAVGPEGVARTILSEAEEALRRVDGAPSYDPVSRERALGLIEGARSALQGQDYTRAIRRAFYAKLLLGASAPGQPID